MEKLNKIREELLASQRKLAKELQLAEDDCKSLVMNGIGYFITNRTLLARTRGYEIEVNDYFMQRITITGEIQEAVKALAKPMKQWRKIANFAKDLDTKEYYLNLFKRIATTSDCIVRNGNEYVIDGFKFYFPDLNSMQITMTNGSFYAVVERVVKEYCVDENVQYGGTDMLDYIKTHEEQIFTNLLEQMSDEAVFGAQLIQEDRREEAIADAKEIANEEI